MSRKKSSGDRARPGGGVPQQVIYNADGEDNVSIAGISLGEIGSGASPVSRWTIRQPRPYAID